MSKIKVSERAVLQRLNRALKPIGQVVKQCKTTARNHAEFGDFYVVDRTAVIAKRIDLAQWAADAGVLQPYEVVGEFETPAEVRVALAHSMAALCRREASSTDLKDLLRDARAFNRSARGADATARVATPLISGGMEVLPAA